MGIDFEGTGAMTPESCPHGYPGAERLRCLECVKQTIAGLTAELASANEHEVALEADVEKGDETETRLRGQLEQAKEQFALLNAAYKLEVQKSLDGERLLREAKEMLHAELPFRLELARVNRELAEAKERERQLREALTSIHQRYVDGPAEWHMMAWAMNSDAEAALTVPPAKEKP